MTISNIKSNVKSNVKSNIKSNYNNYDEDDNISNVDDDTHISHANNNEVLPDVFKQSVVSYVKIDDMIRSLQDDIKELKKKKVSDEEIILEYLENTNENSISLNSGKLIRNKSETKTPLKLDIIKEAICEGIIKINGNNNETKNIVENILESMDKKRPTKVRINLKRTIKKD